MRCGGSTCRARGWRREDAATTAAETAALGRSLGRFFQVSQHFPRVASRRDGGYAAPFADSFR